MIEQDFNIYRLETCESEIIEIYREIYNNFKILQKDITKMFQVRFTWIKKLKDFNKENPEINVMFLILGHYIKLGFNTTINKYLLIINDDNVVLPIWKNKYTDYHDNYQVFLEHIESTIRTEIPEYDKILTRLEKINRIIDDE